MAVRNAKLALASLLVLGAMAVVLFKHQAYARLREQTHALARKLGQLERLEEENQRLHGLAAELRQDSPDRLLDELARLRREAEALRTHQVEWEQLCSENRQLRAELGDTVRPLLSKEAWTYLGYGDPESAAQSYFWALKTPDPKALIESMCPEDRAHWANASEEEVARLIALEQKALRKIPGFQILGVKRISDDQVEVVMNMYPDRPDITNLRLPLKRVGSEWKPDRVFPKTPPP